MLSGVLFSTEERSEFKQYITKMKFDKEMSLRKAMVCGYLDICRSPLKGIGQYISEPDTPTTVRDAFIDKQLTSAINSLIEHKYDYDDWHKKLCKMIISHYCEIGYPWFTYGKTQKWINMTMKYILLYNLEYSEKLKEYIPFLHVPIDRFVAPFIAGKIHYLPKDIEARQFELLDASFDPDRVNYCWSKIYDYGEYLECQMKLREALEPEKLAPLRWEFDEWLKTKKMRKGKGTIRC